LWLLLLMLWLWLPLLCLMLCMVLRLMRLLRLLLLLHLQHPPPLPRPPPPPTHTRTHTHTPPSLNTAFHCAASRRRVDAPLETSFFSHAHHPVKEVSRCALCVIRLIHPHTLQVPSHPPRRSVFYFDIPPFSYCLVLSYTRHVRAGWTLRERRGGGGGPVWAPTPPPQYP
jgi:hypothetical protein